MKATFLILQTAALLAFTSFANAQNSVYSADYSNLDYSGFGASGGSFDVPYYLTSGADINGGNPILVEYHISALSNGYQWELTDIFNSPVPNLTFTDFFRIANPAWQSGDPMEALATVSYSVASVTGYEVVSDRTHIAFNNSNPVPAPEYTWETTWDGENYATGGTGYIGSHFEAHTVGFLLNELGGTLPPQQERFRWTHGSLPANVAKNELTFGPAPIPEPSGVLLVALSGSLALLRRRRTT